MTAYQETAAYVRELLRDATIDEDALARPISGCDLARCHGTCCHDGVYLNPDESRVIRQLVAENRKTLNGFGIDLPENPIVFGKTETASGPKTATRPVPMAGLVEDYPAHFAETNCVFLAEDGRCALQRFAESRDLHPWYYKPFTCWMHPLSIQQAPGSPPLVTLHSPETDPQMSADYPGFVSQTHCGRIDACGQPGRTVLASELAALEEIAGHRLPPSAAPTQSGLTVSDEPAG